MKRRVFSYLILFALMFSTIYASTTLNCEFRTSCLDNEVDFLYANKHFTDSNGNVLSSNVAVNFDSNYNQILCCKSQYGDLDVSFVRANQDCVNGQELMYFTSHNNSRVRFYDYQLLEDKSFTDFNLSHYGYKSCVVKPDEFALFDIIASDKDYSVSGYTCMYKINDLENGLVSSCDAKFAVDNQYKFTVWGRLWEDVSSLKCNADCTSKLDGRVYSACAVQVEACRNVAQVCNGALLNSWISISNDEEVLCSPNWDLRRSKLFTSIPIEITSTSDKCENMVSKSYPVILDNKQVNMKIYVCED